MSIPTDLDPRIERTRKVVLEATAELIGECGFGRTSVEAISERSGVARSTIYRHWPERDALLFESVGKKMERIQASYTGELRADLILTFSHLGEMLSDESTRSILASFFAESTRDPHMARLNTKITKVRREAISRLIEDAVAQGKLPAKTDSHQMADDLVAGIFFKGMILREAPDTDWIEAHVDRWIHIYSAG
jgi:AcrR family transcriptional regulator